MCLCMDLRLYSAVHPNTNRCQNAMLPGAPHSMMTQEEENAVRWHVEIRAKMRALTRDSKKEVSVQNWDFWCGNDWVKSEHVWRLWLDRRTTQERGIGPDKSDLDPVAIHRLSMTYSKLWQCENLNLFQASSDSDFASSSFRVLLHFLPQNNGSPWVQSLQSKT